MQCASLRAGRVRFAHYILLNLPAFPIFGSERRARRTACPQRLFLTLLCGLRSCLILCVLHHLWPSISGPDCCVYSTSLVVYQHPTQTIIRPDPTSRYRRPPRNLTFYLAALVDSAVVHNLWLDVYIHAVRRGARGGSGSAPRMPRSSNKTTCLGRRTLIEEMLRTRDIQGATGL